MDRLQREKGANRIEISKNAPNELTIQRYLRSGKTLEDAHTEYGLSVSRHHLYPNLVGLKYGLLSPREKKIVQECRGLVLDELDNWKVIARPFDKFFNYGEPHADDIDWTTAVVQEKVDGTLIYMYDYHGHVLIGTTGMPDGNGPVGGFYKGTYADLFWETLRVYYRMTFVPREWTYFMGRPLTTMFELTTPYNRVVVKHTDPSITVLAARFADTGEEWDLHSYGSIFDTAVPTVKEFPIGTIEEVLSAADEIDPLAQEGYVVRDASFRRIKVKSPAYIALHHMVAVASPKQFVDVIRAGETAEVLTAFPEFTQSFDELQKRYDTLVSEVEAAYASVSGIQDKKEYAMAVKDHKYSSILFSLYNKKTESVRTFLRDCTNLAAMRLLGLKGE